MSRSNRITIDDVLQLTNNGHDIFQNELGCIPRKNINSPLRGGDNIPSFGVFCHNGMWFYKDQGGNGDSGTAIQFVQKRYGLTFGKALSKIISDLGIKKSDKIYKAIEHSLPPVIEKEPMFIEFVDMPFTKEHHKYWNAYHLDEDFLRKNDVFAVREWACNKRKMKIEENVQVFAYLASDIGRSKILQIGVRPQDKWRNSIPNNYIWNYYKYSSPVEDLFVCKSRKDELVIQMLGYDTISVQNESAKILLEHNKEAINLISPSPIMCFGSDKQGIGESTTICEETGWRNFHTPLYLEKHGINDPAEVSKEFSLEILLKLLNKEGFYP